MHAKSRRLVEQHAVSARRHQRCLIDFHLVDHRDADGRAASVDVLRPADCTRKPPSIPIDSSTVMRTVPLSGCCATRDEAPNENAARANAILHRCPVIMNGFAKGSRSGGHRLRGGPYSECGSRLISQNGLTVKLAKYIANLGYGSRRDVTRMLDDGRVTNADGRELEEGDELAHEDIFIDGERLDPPPGSILILHKPVGYVCSTRGSERLIYELFPERFRVRSPVMAPIGRLDLETSGLLLLTDDGQVNHRITSPRTHLPKVYEAELANDLTGNEAGQFASGTLLLDSETEALKPASLEVVDSRHVRVTLTEGRYHQVRRMFAAVGNHVVSLRRAAVGDLQLGDLATGEWRVISADERKLLGLI